MDKNIPMKKLSVIIVTYNSEKHIYDCLESLFKFNDIGEDLEVIVVDNCSKEYEKMAEEIVKRYSQRVRLIQNSKNGGYGQGNNVGIRASKAPYIMIMNPDVRMCEPIFQKVLEKFDGDDSILLHGIKQYHQDGRPGKSMGWTTRCNPYICEPIRYILCKMDIYWQRYMFFNGSCFFVRKSSFEQVGLFDENIFMYCEEDDIHGRLLKIEKAHFVYDRSLSCLHLHDSVGDYGKEGYGWMQKNLESQLYLDHRDGIPQLKTLKRAIGRTDMSILFTKDKTKKAYFKKWKEKLISMKNAL